MDALPDYIKPGIRILLVGINPGLRSARVGHHFAGYSNRFWRLLYDSRLITEPLDFHDDWRLPEWDLGLTNMITRPTAGSANLRKSEYQASYHTLKCKVKATRPAIVAVLGITLGNVLAKHSASSQENPSLRAPKVRVGLQPFHFVQARVFVLPNPSGRNAHYSYRRMLTLFKELRRIRDQTQ